MVKGVHYLHSTLGARYMHLARRPKTVCILKLHSLHQTRNTWNFEVLIIFMKRKVMKDWYNGMKNSHYYKPDWQGPDYTFWHMQAVETEDSLLVSQRKPVFLKSETSLSQKKTHPCQIPWQLSLNSLQHLFPQNVLRVPLNLNLKM